MNNKICQIFLIVLFAWIVSYFHISVSHAQTSEANRAHQTGDETGERVDPSGSEKTEEAVAEAVSSRELVRMSWEASGNNKVDEVFRLTQQCFNTYGAQAFELNAQLEDFPPRDAVVQYQVLNDVGTCMFIRAETLMNNGQAEEAIEIFQRIIDDYRWAQAWDPRGWYWSIAEKSQASIDMLEGRAEEKDKEPPKVDRGIMTMPRLAEPGVQVVDYTKYGTFMNVGTKQYSYKVNDPVGLSAAVGEGVYPNTGAVRKDPNYEKAKEEGRLEGSHWDFVHTDDLEAALYKWALAPEPWGVKLFYIGLIFEKARMYYEAIKAYHAIVVHFPRSTGRTYWNTPWYPGQAAIAKIRHLIRIHPELGLTFEWAKIRVINGADNDVSNDQVITYPGRVRRLSLWDKVRSRFARVIDQIGFGKKRAKLGEIKRRLNEGRVQLVQYENDHWQILVEGKPFIIKGITYVATKVGQSPDKGTLTNWMTEDTNGNGLADGPYDSWVDANRNNQQDEDEPVVGDFRLLKELGANVIRVYHQPFEPDKELLRAMYEETGIMVVMGDFLGKYALGSGASWYEGTDYENPEHRKNMLDSVKKIVMEYKDEPYILMWLLGNENNYGVACNADTKPEAYYAFVDEVAAWIKSVDPDHPVAMCNGDVLYLDIFAKFCPNVDAFAANAYRGDYGFGAFWEQVSDATGKPGFITEYGCPAYAGHLSREDAEEAQADYHLGNWMDIEKNAAGTKEGAGNAIGGIVFEWMDEWWKNYEPAYHDKTAGAQGPFPDGYMYEEWFGLIGQGNGKHSPFLRQLRESYFLYKELWNK